MGDGLRRGGAEEGIEGQEGEGKKKNRKIRNGMEDMCGIDGMIMVKLGHEGKMRGFREGERKGGRVTQDGARDCGHTGPRRHENKKKSNGGIGI